MTFFKTAGVFAACAVLLVAANTLSAQVPQLVADTVDPQVYKEVVQKGVTYLIEKGQNREDGSFSSDKGPGVTALCVTALLDSGVSADNPAVDRAIKYLLKFVQKDGGLYAPESVLKNYETSLAVMALSRANTNGKHDATISKAVAFLKELQWDEGEGHDPSSPFYGGQGYGSHQRPDMSNTSFFIDALKDSGEPMDSEAMRKAILFMSRAQNLATEHNTAKFASKAGEEDRGGFIYSPVGEGETKAEKTEHTPEGGLRSYASMTYTGLKSFLYAKVQPDDIRVQAAIDWIRRNYDVESNPGIGQQGLYYYYHVFAKALNELGDRTIKDAEGTLHNWRSDLLHALAERQNADGSWINGTDRWYEGDPNLVSAYSLMALRYCSPELDRDE